VLLGWIIGRDYKWGAETRLRRLYPTPLNRQSPAPQQAGFGLGTPPALLAELVLRGWGLGSPNAFAQAMTRPPRRIPSTWISSLAQRAARAVSEEQARTVAAMVAEAAARRQVVDVPA
jgi:hypothetical protein